MAPQGRGRAPTRREVPCASRRAKAHTVETYVVEAMTGDGQKFDEAVLRRRFHRIHEVSEAELVVIALRNDQGLDDGAGEL